MKHISYWETIDGARFSSRELAWKYELKITGLTLDEKLRAKRKRQRAMQNVIIERCEEGLCIIHKENI